MPELFRSAFEQAMIGMAMVTPDGRWLRVNPALCTLLGYSREELLAVGFRPLIERADLADGGDDLLHLLDGTGKPFEAERRFRTRQGRELWLHLHISLVRDAADSPDYLIVQVQDVTLRRAVERERAAVLAQLQRSNGELERFAAVASHDLQEPLRKIRAFSDRLLLTERERVSEQGRDSLARMQQAAARMQALINGLLAYSRAVSQSLVSIPTDLGLLVGEVLRDLESQLARTGGRVELGDLPTVHGDPLRLRQLFQNLIANALKFHRPGVPPVVTIRAERRAGPADPERADLTGEHWCIVVGDNGIGFDERYRDRIFGMFQRLHGRNEYDGSGIGLALCRQIAERHGGRITAEGEPGAGSRFSVALPIPEHGEDVDG